MSRRRQQPGSAAGPSDIAVAVIGAGSAGVAAARAAAVAAKESGEDGARVVLIGDARPGGAAHLVADGGVLLECATAGLDWHATLAHLRAVRAVVEDRCREAALRADGVSWVPGRARLLGAGRIAIDPTGGAGDRAPEVLTARRIVLATGEEDRLPDLAGLHETRYLTATSLLGLAQLPPSLVVLGGGAHGCELAQAMARFGVGVTLIEAADRLLPQEHPEASAQVTRALRADGVRVFTGAPAVTVAPTLDGGAWVGTGSGADLAGEGLLLATGRRAAVRGLDPAAAGVRLTASGWVQVDERLATTGEGVFAVGSVTGLLPHGASDPVMAEVGGRNSVARRPRGRWSGSELPRVVRTAPAVASVGVAPAQAATIPGARVNDLPLVGFDRALVSQEGPTGLVSLVTGPPQPRRPGGLAGLVAGRSGRGRGRGESTALLGASIVGPQAGELAGMAALALSAGMSVEELARAPLSSRTWGSALQFAAAGFEALV